MKAIFIKIKQLWEEYSFLFLATILEGLMLYSTYYALIGRYVFRDRIGSSRLAVLSIISGLMAMILVALYDYFYVFKRKDSDNCNNK